MLAPEGIDCSRVRHAKGELPGLYFIETDEGERSFFIGVIARL